MRKVLVDPVTKTIRAEGGCTQADLNREAHAFSLAVPLGVISTTGIAGLTLGGGTGYLTRKYGLTVDNLIEANLVLADGHFVTASVTENPDLFWGIRGGGGNFGIVTSFRFRLHPVGPVLGGLLLYPMASARTVLRFYDEYTRTAPDELGSIAALATLPDGTQAAVIIVAYNGPLDQGEEVV